MNFIRDIVTSRTGQIFFLVHLVVITVCLESLRGLSEAEYNSHYLRKVFFMIALFDYPAFYFIRPLVNNLGLESIKLKDLIANSFVSFQWWIIGYFIKTLVRGIKNLFSN